MLHGAWIAAALTAATAAPAAMAEAGELDRTFGDGGRVVTPVKFHTPWSETKVQLAKAPDGRIVVAGGRKLVRYLADGRLDPGFGHGGRKTIALPRERRFALDDLAVDREGRVVVVGTVGAYPSFAAVIRYEPDGELDPSFGGDGIVMTDFGLRSGTLRAAGVTATLGALDDRGRLTLVAGTVQPVRTCGSPPRKERRDRLVARLMPTGALDRTFGHGGISRIEPLRTVASMAFDRKGGPVLAGVPRNDCSGGAELALIRLHPDGSRNRRFGDRGSRRLAGSLVAIALDDRGRIVVLGQSRQPPAGNESSTEMVRLLPSGRIDPSFFDGGLIFSFEGPLARWSALTVDSRERPLIVGTLIRPISRKGEPPFHRWFMVIRLRESGDFEGLFGRNGWSEITRFDPHSDAAASEASIDDEGRLLVAGTAFRPLVDPRPGLALARFDLAPSPLYEDDP